MSFLNAAEKAGSITQAEINKNVEVLSSIGIKSHIEDQKREQARERQKLYNRWLELKREIYSIEKLLKISNKAVKEEPSKSQSTVEHYGVKLIDGKWVDIRLN